MRLQEKSLELRLFKRGVEVVGDWRDLLNAFFSAGICIQDDFEMIRRSHSDIAELSSFRGRYTNARGKWLFPFRRNVVPLSSG
jgi:hypothetical protein